MLQQTHSLRRLCVEKHNLYGDVIFNGDNLKRLLVLVSAFPLLVGALLVFGSALLVLATASLELASTLLGLARI